MPPLFPVRPLPFLGLCLVLGPSASLGSPSWIWASGPAANPAEWAPSGDIFLRHTFEVPASLSDVTTATLDVGVDNRAEVFLNGRSLGESEGWNPMRRSEVTKLLRGGRNVVAVRAINTGPGPAGFIAELKIKLRSGREIVIASGPDWKATDKEPGEHWHRGEWEAPAALAFAQNGDLPWGISLPPRNDQTFPSLKAKGADLEPLNDMLRRFHASANMDVAGTYALAWLPRGMLWVSDSKSPGESITRRRIANRLGGMRISPEGYVSCHQHEGLAHSEGWPFPFPSQSQGFSFYFTLSGLPFGPEFGLPLVTEPAGWRLENAETKTMDAARGWTVALTGPGAVLSSPAFDVDAFVSPFIRVKWNAGKLPADARPELSWISTNEWGDRTEHRLPFPAPSAASRHPVQDFDIPVQTLTQAKGRITALRIHFNNTDPGEVTIQRIFSAVDSRHPINNPNYLVAATDFYRWTGDREWLLRNLPRMRLALRYMLSEFAVRETGLIRRPWVGHDGRSGLEITPEGRKIIHHGVGIGGNYWDLMPFGGDDVIATTYLHPALAQMAALEELAAREFPAQAGAPEEGLDAASLRRLAGKVLERFRSTFWNPETLRFAPIDDQRRFRDYGYTFVNNEAIFYGLADELQARDILAWTSGDRIVEGDTSTGADIYRWRFGPRASTRRNISYYQYVWSAPESLAFGDQVQDGGAVLGFAFHDLVARIRHRSPDDAWARLLETFEWYREVQAAGGARAYYSVPGRGTLQGGGTAGGLGIDEEFYESVLIASVLLEGFLGFEPRPDGFDLHPRLPAAVPAMTITDIAYRRLRWDVEFSSQRVAFRVAEGQPDRPLLARLAEGRWTGSAVGPDGRRIELRSTDGRSFTVPAEPLKELIFSRTE